MVGRTWAVGLAALLAACGSSDLVLPGDGVPSALAPVKGDGQTGEAGRMLPESLVVSVTDHNGAAVAGAVVQWSAHGGAPSSSTTATDASGRAKVAWTLGPSPGTQTMGVVIDSGVPQATFTATAVPRTVHLELIAVPPDTVRRGRPLDPAPVVQLRDADGSPVVRSGVAVTAAIASGGGSLEGTTTEQTDEQGRAAFDDLSLSGTPGPRRLIFAAESAAAVTSAAITLIAGPVDAGRSSIAASPGSIRASGGSDAASVVVTALDASGSPIAGAPVVFTASGGATISGADAVTAADGTARAVVSGTAAGTKTIGASVDGVPLNHTASVTITPAGLAVDHTTVKLPGTLAAFRSASVVVHTNDAYDNPLTGGGATVTVTVNSQAARVTDLGDGSYQADFAVYFPGTYTIDVQVNGREVPGSPWSRTAQFQ